MSKPGPGLSGISLYLPAPRVDLASWCEWNGQAFDKVGAVVGRGFRMPGVDENVYTMAATAVLRLIEAYDVDPRHVGMLALGTESSTDNAAGAVIVRGMLDRALIERGKPALARDCEVPEIKHACLAGVYGLKAATRYLAVDGRDRVAIVVCGDIAEYERGSSGEPTQGAGAVAMLCEPQARLAAIELASTGSASAYRGLDFRKPVARHFVEGYAAATQRLHDFPIFNGKYSTACYIDEVIAALDAMFVRRGIHRRSYWEQVATLVMHRPYHHMPIAALAAALVVGMHRDPAEHEAFAGLCIEAGQDPAGVRAELDALPDLWAFSEREGVDADPMPRTNAVVKRFRAGAWFRRFVDEKVALGGAQAMEFGNLYSASLPAWLAAMFTDALGSAVELAGREVLTIGYGSGDAAEAMPLTVAPGWKEAATRIDLEGALAGAITLERAAYEAHHDGRVPLAPAPGPRFGVVGVGDSIAPPQDLGVERYGFLP